MRHFYFAASLALVLYAPIFIDFPARIEASTSHPDRSVRTRSRLRDIDRMVVSSHLSDVSQHAVPAESPRFQSISAIHSYFGEAILASDSANPETTGSQSPTQFQLGRCHALRSDGAAAAKIFFAPVNSAADGVLS
jgi:hypothetical protein